MLQIEIEVQEFLRQKLAERVEQLGQDQRDFLYKRMFPVEAWPNGVPENKLISVIDLCDRTIKKNIADPTRLERKEAPGDKADGREVGGVSETRGSPGGVGCAGG